MSKATGLELLNVPKKVIPLHGGRKLTVRPVPIGRLTLFAQAVNPLMTQIAQAIDGDADLLQIIMDNADAMIEVVHIGAHVDREEVAAMLTDEFITVAAAVVTVNASFFLSRLQAVLPQMTRIMQAAQTKLADAGLTESKPS